MRVPKFLYVIYYLDIENKWQFLCVKSTLKEARKFKTNLLTYKIVRYSR